jgi:hypothetical protein
VAAARHRAFEAGIDALDSIVLQPLGLEGSHIVLVVPAEMHALPWAAMASLRHRSFALAPSVRWWIDAASAGRGPPRSALVVAGPRLVEAEAEACGVAACHRRATLLTGVMATVTDVGAAMGRHDAVHIVAHGTFRHDNPLWSTIELDDGQLTVYELERLGKVPATMVLATCESGVGVSAASATAGRTLLTMGEPSSLRSVHSAMPPPICMVDLHHDLQPAHRLGIAGSATLGHRGLA